MDIEQVKYIIQALDNYTKNIKVEELHEIAYWFCLESLIGKEPPESAKKIIKEVVGEDIIDAWNKNKEHNEFINNIRYHLSISYLVRNK